MSETHAEVSWPEGCCYGTIVITTELGDSLIGPIGLCTSVELVNLLHHDER